jgi:alpha-D-ribose 1-methylphosphonate 5-phosphate C-P lyase
MPDRDLPEDLPEVCILCGESRYAVDMISLHPANNGWWVCVDEDRCWDHQHVPERP